MLLRSLLVHIARTLATHNAGAVAAQRHVSTEHHAAIINLQGILATTCLTSSPNLVPHPYNLAPPDCDSGPRKPPIMNCNTPRRGTIITYLGGSGEARNRSDSRLSRGGVQG